MAPISKGAVALAVVAGAVVPLPPLGAGATLDVLRANISLRANREGEREGEREEEEEEEEEL